MFSPLAALPRVICLAKEAKRQGSRHMRGAAFVDSPTDLATQLV
jgi:hypothetical protein